MACPTCDHTMQAAVTAATPPAIGAVIFYWCPRCGTTDDISGVHVPKLVERCREFGPTLGPGWGQLWRKLGIEEAIHKPEDRTT